MDIKEYYSRFIEPLILNNNKMDVKLELYTIGGTKICDNYCDTTSNEFDGYQVYARKHSKFYDDNNAIIGVYVV